MRFNRNKFHSDPIVFPDQSVACSLSNFCKAMTAAVAVEFYEYRKAWVVYSVYSRLL